MKRTIAVGLAALFAVAAPAGAATPLARIAKLEKQVKTLTAQVKTLRSQEQFDRSEIQANYAGDVCAAATFSDLLQSTWAIIDQGSATPKFLPEPQVDDRNECKGLGVARQGIKLPPSVSVVTALIHWLIGT